MHHEDILKAEPDVLSAALAYAAKGLPVFPCKPHNKSPHTDHSFKDASTDAEQIERWWKQWPDALIGIPAGENTRFWVLDIDDPAAFEAACKISLPQTRRVDTGKGYHLYFKWDADKPVGNKQQQAKKDGGTTWPFPSLPGAETRGEGGYVIVPPSLHPSGRRYEWHGEANIVEAPKALLETVRKAEESPNPSQTPPKSGSTTAYGRKALEDECAKIRSASNGTQEGTLNDAALKIGGLVAGGEIDQTEARQALIAAGCDMASHNDRDPWTPEKITKKVERGLQDGKGNPRSAPDQSNSEPWPEPVDLWASPKAPSLPEGLLPTVIEDFARAKGESMGCDPAGIAMAALACCAGAISDEIKVRPKPNESWTEAARIWVGLVGNPSTKKSPIIGQAIKPLRKREAAFADEHREAMREYQALPKESQQAREAPIRERRLVEDATIESLQNVLKDTPRGIMSVQDEMTGWFGRLEKYSSNGGSAADRGFWLQAYNGGGYSVDRVGRGSFHIRNNSISLVGGVQPDPIRRLANGSHDDGLIQRIIPVMLAPATLGSEVSSAEAEQRYRDLFDRLELLKPPHDESVKYYAQPPVVTMSATAQALRFELEAEHMELVQAFEGMACKLATALGKHDGLFARLCLIWHCIETEQGTTVGSEIGQDTAQRVAAFLRHFIRRHLYAFHIGVLGMAGVQDELQKMAAWIVAKQIKTATAREVLEAGQAFRGYSADEVRVLFEKMEAFGWGNVTVPSGRAYKPHFQVNPRVFELFAQRGAAELERRETAKRLMAEAFEVRRR